MITIPLGEVLLDDEDYDLIKGYKWYINENGYAATTVGRHTSKKTVKMHRMIMGLSPHDGKIVDHINRNRLDNRRSNLRLVTRIENIHNSGIRHDNTSGHRGVTWDKNRGKWKVHFGTGKGMNIGRFDTKEAAIAARQSREIEAFGHVVQ